jgi:hypothetical protein
MTTTRVKVRDGVRVCGGVRVRVRVLRLTVQPLAQLPA